METGFSPSIEHRSTSFVDSDVSAVDDVEGSGSPQRKDNDSLVNIKIPTNTRPCSSLAMIVDMLLLYYML